MADLTANADVTFAAASTEGRYVIADGVTLYTHALVGLEGGFLNHWADGANDRFAGLFITGDARATAGVFIGETGDAIPPEGRVRTDGVTLMHLASVEGITGWVDTGKAVYCSTSNVTDMTIQSSGKTHVIGYVERFRSTTDVDVRLFSIGEAIAHANA